MEFHQHSIYEIVVWISSSTPLMLYDMSIYSCPNLHRFRWTSAKTNVTAMFGSLCFWNLHLKHFSCHDSKFYHTIHIHMIYNNIFPIFSFYTISDHTVQATTANNVIFQSHGQQARYYDRLCFTTARSVIYQHQIPLLISLDITALPLDIWQSIAWCPGCGMCHATVYGYQRKSQTEHRNCQPVFGDKINFTPCRFYIYAEILVMHYTLY